MNAKRDVFLVGGAVMCLVHDAREATRDVDGLLRPASVVREAALRVRKRADVPPKWLVDHALQIVQKFFGESSLQPTTRLALEELLSE